MSMTSLPRHGMNRRQAVQQSTAAIAGSSSLTLSSSFPTSVSAATDAAATPIETSSTTTTSTVLLTDKTPVTFPLVAFGLQIYDDATAYRLTTTALEVGYRNFFASALTGNVRGFSRAIRDSQIPRSELFICGSVVSNRAVGFDAARHVTDRGWHRAMEEFSVGNVDYLDQIMLDYPGPDCDSIRGQWAAFEEMAAQKLTRTLAVSNFSPSQLDCILVGPPGSSSNSNNNKNYQCQVKPVVNQLPYSIAYHSPNVIQDNRERGILVQAWAPLGGSLGGRFTASKQAACAAIGKKYGNKSYAQVALRWIIQTGAAFATQSTKKEHFQQDLDIFDFELSQEDMALLSAL